MSKTPRSSRFVVATLMLIPISLACSASDGFDESAEVSSPIELELLPTPRLDESLPGLRLEETCKPPGDRVVLSLGSKCEEVPKNAWACGGEPYECIPSKPTNTDADCQKFKAAFEKESYETALSGCKYDGVKCKNKSCAGVCVLDATTTQKKTAKVRLWKNGGPTGYCLKDDMCIYDAITWDCVCECLEI